MAINWQELESLKKLGVQSYSDEKNSITFFKDAPIEASPRYTEAWEDILSYWAEVLEMHDPLVIDLLHTELQEVLEKSVADIVEKHRKGQL